MKFSPMTADGDMTAGQPCLTDHEACIAAIRSRLSLFQGEWWEDPAQGLTVPPFLSAPLRTEAAMHILANSISGYILDTPGVVAVDKVRFSRSGHVFSYTCNVTTQWSKTSSLSTSLQL